MFIARLHLSIPLINSACKPLLRSFSLGPRTQRNDPQSVIPGPNYIRKSRMPAWKRKRVLNAALATGTDHKRLKNKASQSTKARRTLQVLETETDSDPIVESDTTEHSGDDDGASWPSDDAPAAQDLSAAKEGGMTNSKVASENRNVKPKAPSAKHAGNGMISSGAPGSSKEAHARQKAVTLERKAAKPNADLIAQSKQLWERLRRKSHVPLAERKKLVAELFDIVTGRVKDFVFKHDSVRVVETALKYANIDQRKMIARELQGEYRSLAESKYAKFLVGKLLVHGDEAIRDMVIPELYGHVRHMMNHPEASWILDDIYRGVATPSQKARLLREWYGAEFAIFKTQEATSGSADLKELLATHPEKRGPMMSSLHKLIDQLVQKKRTGFTILHDAMLQYFLNVQPGSEDATEFIERLKGDEEGDLLTNLCFTKSGARLVCLALSHGNARDRKQILKSIKTLIQTLAYDPSGHQVFLAVYDVIDDTVLVSKSVVAELTGKDLPFEAQTQALLASAVDRNARVALLYPFAGKSKAILPAADLALLDEIHQIRLKTSKKIPEIRRQELVAALSPPLLSLISYNAEALVENSFGCQFVAEVLLNAAGDRGPASRAVAGLARTKPQLFEAPAAGRMLKTLVVGGHFNAKTGSVDRAEPPLGFPDVLWGKIQDDIVAWAVSDNSFVVLAMLEAEGFEGKEELKETLRRERKRLEQAAGAGEKTGDPEAESKMGSKEGGNRGTQLLLKMI